MVQLQNRLANAQDTKDVQDLQARLQSEQAYIQSQSAQVQTLAIMQVAAYQSLQQQREEERQRDIDAVLAADGGEQGAGSGETAGAGKYWNRPLRD
jgi:hypothetical protein